MAFDGPAFHSCTPGDSLRLLDACDVPLVGKHAVAAGRSPIPGESVGMLLLARNGSTLAPWSWTPDTTPAMLAMSTEFAPDPLAPPAGVVSGHSGDQLAHLRGQPRPSESRAGLPAEGRKNSVRAA
jgi:Tetrahydrofolate dehydrogenase/cyclohydrolase, NAD(P)-binding domain